MSEFTTIQITNELKDKLTAIKKKNGKKYNDIIEDLLYNMGSEVDDVITLEREAVAFSLKYWNNQDDYKIFEVTYKYLKGLSVGDIITVCDNPVGDEWVNSSAQVIYHNGEDVILMVEEISNNHDNVNCIKSVVHVKLF